jgi:peroxiredoxin
MRVYALSGDPPEALRELQAELGLAVTLLSDTKAEAIAVFGMRDPQGVPHENTARAGTFVIDRQGRVARRWIAPNYRKRPSADEILRHLIP